MLSDIKTKNRIKINSVNDEVFHKYGKVLKSEAFETIFAYLRNDTDIPEEGNIYVAADDELKKRIENHQYFENLFGTGKIQFGYVNGQNTRLNALEFHKSPEIDVCETSLVLLLAEKEKIIGGEISSEDIEAFFIPEGTCVLLNPGILHFSPCKTSDSGFKCGVILPYGTNMDLIAKKQVNSFEDRLLFKNNKWLIAHKENRRLVDLGAYTGIKGENIEIKY